MLKDTKNRMLFMCIVYYKSSKKRNSVKRFYFISIKYKINLYLPKKKKDSTIFNKNLIEINSKKDVQKQENNFSFESVNTIPFAFKTATL